MKKGDYVSTPRFCTVRIKEVFNSPREALKAGYTEPTHYHDWGYTVFGMVVGNPKPGWCKMEFAGVKE